MWPLIIDHILGGDSASSTEYSNSQSNGVVVAIACVMTFIVTLIATIIITFIMIFIFIKKKFADIAKDTTADEQTTATAETDTVIYDTVGPPSVTNNKGEYELPNPGYDKSHKLGMVTNPAYKTCK